MDIKDIKNIKWSYENKNWLAFTMGSTTFTIPAPCDDFSWEKMNETISRGELYSMCTYFDDLYISAKMKWLKLPRKTVEFDLHFH